MSILFVVTAQVVEGDTVEFVKLCILLSHSQFVVDELLCFLQQLQSLAVLF
jgi:hypothetical protein